MGLVNISGIVIEMDSPLVAIISRFKLHDIHINQFIGSNYTYTAVFLISAGIQEEAGRPRTACEAPYLSTAMRAWFA